MPNWFLGTIRYQQVLDDSTVGTRNEEFTKQKTITESYLVDAVSYTDAEARLYQNIAANTPDFEIARINRMNLADIFDTEGNAETWYKVKAVFITDDEKTGKQKKTPSLMLVNALSVRQAFDRVEEKLMTAHDPFEITDVNLTKILEIFPYDENEGRNLRPLTAAEAENLEPSQKGEYGQNPYQNFPSAGAVIHDMLNNDDEESDESGD